jgi:large subunit ribosomal protein L29
MDIKELKKLGRAELDEHLLALQREQFNLRMQQGSGQLTQTHQLKRVRRDIARTKMLIGAGKQEQS